MVPMAVSGNSPFPSPAPRYPRVRAPHQRLLIIVRRRCMGTYSGDSVVEIDYPLAFANAVAKTIPAHKKKFRYVHLGGAFTESDQERRLWFLPTARRVRVGL